MQHNNYISRLHRYTASVGLAEACPNNKVVGFPRHGHIC